MSDTLDAWYQRELDYFRHSAGEFADRFPKIANRLNLSGADIRDPHVERLIQAFAYLNARTRHKLDDSFPELADAMLGILYPHMVTPVPSMSILKFGLHPAQVDHPAGLSIPAGRSLETEEIQGHQCRFQTCYPVKLFPLNVDGVRLLQQPFSGPSTPQKGTAASALRFRLSTFDSKAKLSNYQLDSFRFYINISNFEKAAKLLQCVLEDCIEIVLDDDEGHVKLLSPECIRHVGLGPDEAVIPDNPRSFPGYRLLTEYFVLPQKFLFFEVTGITPDLLASMGNQLHLSLLLKDFPEELENVVSAETLLMGCTPVINLFHRTADAIPMSYRGTEYRIIPDARAENAMEVHSIRDVRLETDDGEIRPFGPFYSVQHSGSSDKTGYWHATRRPGPVDGDAGTLNKATEMWISLVDPNFSARRNLRGTIYTNLVCFNRDLPEALAQQRTAGQVQFDLVGGGGPVSEIECLIAPTPTQRRHLGRRNLWPLISQLSLNHLTLLDSKDAVDAFREILVLNDVKESIQTRNLVDGLKAVSSERDVQRIGSTFARGTLVKLMFEDENFIGDSAYLFSSILNQFLGMYTSINSYTRLSATTVKRDAQKGKPWTWPPQTGNHALT
ncbi:MAG: type VI secretion system baseplate subunit TssF [Fuerstiella sp.]